MQSVEEARGSFGLAGDGGADGGGVAVDGDFVAGAGDGGVEECVAGGGKDASSPRRMASTTGMQSCRAYSVAKVSNASSGR